MPVLESAERLVAHLAKLQLKLVFAESCTGGMLAAELAKVPGVSNWLCGSAVTYRSETKIAWLDVDAQLIQQQTAVCREVAAAMARGVLRITPEANLAVSITGHFGPDAPEGFDGLVFIGIGVRQANEIDIDVQRCQLNTSLRLDRQAEAVQLVYRLLLEKLA
jgi:nicotinamide-nucleotide amidase